MTSKIWFCSALCLNLCASAQEKRHQVATPPDSQSIIVTGVYEPIPLGEADRDVSVFPVDKVRLLTNSFTDVLRVDTSLDLRGRAPNGIQTDFSIRGGGFGQTLVLIDGLRMNDVQSGHLSMDIPLPLELMDRIEVLKGSGSTLYGSDAVGGAVNFITRRADFSEFRLRGALGSFGVNQEQGILALGSPKLSEQLSFGRDFSTGFEPDRDYRNLSLGSVTNWSSRLGLTTLILANNDRPYGGDQFYGNYNSWERTKTWFAAIKQDIGEHTQVDFGYRRHTDLFVLFRDRPEVFTNRHASENYQTAVRRWDSVNSNSKVYYGLEGYHDSIQSTNLGFHERSRGAGYLATDLRALHRFSFTAGLREEIYGTHQSQFSPSVSGGFWLAPRLKLRASASHAFRLPSYTDLYYHDPANQGSPNLKPEKAWTYEAGADLRLTGGVSAELTVFERREQNGIDYVRYSLTDLWRATNFQKLHFTGVEAVVRATITNTQTLEVGYSGLRGVSGAASAAFSKYTFNYPVHSGTVSWIGELPGKIQARVRSGTIVRFGRDPYTLLDVYAAARHKRVSPFLQFSNVSDTAYEEIFGVRMPGRSIVGGFEVSIFNHGK